MIIDHITTETVAKARVFSEDGTTTDNGSAFAAHASVSSYANDGAITPTSASGFGGGNQARYTFDVRNTLPDGVYNLALFRTTPAIGGAFKLLPFRVYAGALIPIQGGENVTITSRSVSPTPYSRSQVDQKISGTGVSAALLNAVNNASGFAVFDSSGNLVGNWIPSFGTKSEIDATVLSANVIGMTTDENMLRRGDGSTSGGKQLCRYSRVLYHNLSPAGNVGADEDDLHAFTVPAGTLQFDGESIEIVCDFTIGTASVFNHFASFKLYAFGNVRATIAASDTDISSPQARGRLVMYIKRTSATTVDRSIDAWGRAFELPSLRTGFSYASSASLTVSNLNSNAFEIKSTGEDAGTDEGGTGATNNYVTVHNTRITWFAAP